MSRGKAKWEGVESPRRRHSKCGFVTDVLANVRADNGLVLSLQPGFAMSSVGKALLSLRGFGVGCIGFRCYH
jgi:hypothetical protein